METGPAEPWFCDNKPLPCPECGASSFVDGPVAAFGGVVFVRCQGCGSHGPVASYEMAPEWNVAVKRAVRGWNALWDNARVAPIADACLQGVSMRMVHEMNMDL